ncbi:Fe-S oxidoreductase [Planctomycetales bacterium 10988]|nr:Fe-S oxidoreductase [Planctomycetales bacterium 10988]
MLNQPLKEYVLNHLLSQVQSPAQYLGNELNVVRKDHRTVSGKLCMAFPDAYTIGMSHHGLQVLYTLMNSRSDWVCERAFAPQPDFENLLREHCKPLYAWESFTPLSEFDILGFTLQYELCYSNILTMLDLGGIPLHVEERTMHDPLIIAGGPCAQNPEPLADFIDLFVTGDGEPALPMICDLWLEKKKHLAESTGLATGVAGQQQREQVLLELCKSLPFAYVPRFYQPDYREGRFATLNRTDPEVPATIEPSMIRDLDGIPLPTKPIVPYTECVHDRIAIEIMRGCPWQCRFCQSTVIKRPVRYRRVETIVESALESYRNTGFKEISLLSLSSSDYPLFRDLIEELEKVFRPLGVNISLPSLRVNEQLKSVAELMNQSEKKSGLTLAPEVARDDMRMQIRKRIKNETLFEGCRNAFRNGWRKVKLYFMCGLPGERKVDLDGIVEMAETIARIGKEELGRNAQVTASVSNFVPKPHTPYQWNGMQNREYFDWAHRYLWSRRTIKSVNIKCHPIETSLLEGVFTRGDRRLGKVIEAGWRKGARLDAWHEHAKPELWWETIAEQQIDLDDCVHRQRPLGERLPWDHVNVKKGRTFLEREQNKAVVQLTQMADAE